LKSRFVFVIFAVFLLLTDCKKEKTVNEPQKESVKIKISWENKDFPLSMEIYEPAAQRSFQIWETAVANKKDLPVSAKIDGDEFYIKRGGKKLFILVMHNNTKETQRFFAAPHSAEPAEYSFGFKFKCLCVNHAFSILPDGYWYRVVELRLSEKFAGNAIEIKHNLIGISEARMQEIEKNMDSHEME